MWTGERRLDRAFVGLREYGSAVRRHGLIFVLYVLACLGAGNLYLRAVQPDFIATVQLVLQPRRIAVMGPDDERRIMQTILNGEQAETELQVIRSRGLLRGVFAAQHLVRSPELRDRHDGVWSEVYEILHRFAFDPIKPDPEADAFNRFVNRLRARRLATSFVIEIGYRSRDPGLATRVASAVASAYLRGRIQGSYADTEVGAPDLKDRIASILAQDRLAGDAVKQGTLPADYLPDADVRPLGPAVKPLGRAFPSTGPVLAFSAGFGTVSGLLMIALLGMLDAPIRSRKQLQRRLGIDCFGVIDTRRAGLGAAMTRRWSPDRTAETVKAIRAAVQRRHETGHPPAVGFVSCSTGAASRSAAAHFAEALGAAQGLAIFVDLDTPGDDQASGSSRVLRRSAEWLGSPSRQATAVVALPALGVPSEASAIIPLLSCVVLVVEAGHTTCADVRAALHFLHASRRSCAGILFEAGRRG